MIRRHLTYANLVSTFALIIALSGASYAAVVLPRNSVGAPQLKKQAVTAPKLASGSVGTAKVRDGSLLAKDLKPGAIAGIPGFQRVETVVNVTAGQTAVFASAACPAGKRLLGGGYVLQDSKLHATYANSQSNDVFALTAVVLPGQTITGSSQAIAVANCGIVD
jgi:hypothetical protein